MISILQSVLHTFRRLVRRAGLHKRRTAEAYFSLVACPDGCRIRAASPKVAIECQQPGPCDTETILLPLEALNAWTRRSDEIVTFERLHEQRMLISWSDRGVPRQAEFQLDRNAAVDFPERPTTLTANDPGLWPALQSAVTSTDRHSTRYALNCLHFRGSLGQIDATDGRQILSQSGLRFGFEGSVLVPASPLLGCRDLDTGQSVAVGRTAAWVGFGIGSWLVMLPINQEGRFPHVDDILPNHEFARSRLELSATDTAFLRQVLPRLPCDQTHNDPLTLDLNGRVLLRCRESLEARTTEVELTSSQLTGEPVILNTSRQFVDRALKLGFREAFIYGADAPVLCRDTHRRFLWALLDSKSALPRADNPIRIVPPSAASR